jgi:hypothetical protein
MTDEPLSAVVFIATCVLHQIFQRLSDPKFLQQRVTFWGGLTASVFRVEGEDKQQGGGKQRIAVYSSSMFMKLLDYTALHPIR